MEWSITIDCKSIAFGLRWFKSSPTHKIDMEYPIAVKGIIENNNGEILIVKRSNTDDHKPNVWETVGGGMDIKESPQQALAREIIEETGLSVEVKNPFNVFTFKKDTGEFKVGITFICKYLGGDVVLSSEHTDYKWIKSEEFVNFDSIPSLQEEILNYSRTSNK